MKSQRGRNSGTKIKAQDGFTLAELLVTISILGIIMVPLATAIIVGLRTTGDTSLRLAQAQDRRLVARYFITDVDSASSVTTPGSLPVECPTTGPVTILSLAREDDTETVTTIYDLQLINNECQLTRTVTTSSSSQTNTLAHNLKPTDTPAKITASEKTLSLTLTDSSEETYSVTATQRVNSGSA